MTTVILPQSAWAGELPHEAARHFFAHGGRIWRAEMDKRLTDEQLLYLLQQVNIQAMRIPSGVRKLADLICEKILSEALPEGWKEATIAWEVCASIHREYAKKKDPFFTTRQADFVRHTEAARATLLAHIQRGAVPSADQLWNNDEVMALNAELGLTMDQLLRLVRAITRIAHPADWRERFSQAVYDDLAAADNQDVPLEEYPARILKVLDAVIGQGMNPAPARGGEVMSTNAQVPQDHPLMRAWNAFKATPEYANSKSWAQHAEHVDGSLWASFLAGWEACGGEQLRAELRRLHALCGEMGEAITTLKDAFVIATGGKSPFAKCAIEVADEALAKWKESK